MKRAFQITIHVMVRAESCEDAVEQAFALCDMLSPAPQGDVGSPPDVRVINFESVTDLKINAQEDSNGHHTEASRF